MGSGGLSVVRRLVRLRSVARTQRLCDKTRRRLQSYADIPSSTVSPLPSIWRHPAMASASASACLWRPSSSGALRAATEAPSSQPLPPPPPPPCVLRRIVTQGPPMSIWSSRNQSRECAVKHGQVDASVASSLSDSPSESEVALCIVDAAAASATPCAVLPITSALPTSSAVLTHVPDHAAHQTTFSLPGMIGVSGKQYIQVVDVLPEHMLPLGGEGDDDSGDAGDGGDAGGGGGSTMRGHRRASQTAADAPESPQLSVDGRAKGSPNSPLRPSHPKGAWGGRNADEVIEAAQEMDVGRRLR